MISIRWCKKRVLKQNEDLHTSSWQHPKVGRSEVYPCQVWTGISPTNALVHPQNFCWLPCFTLIGNESEEILLSWLIGGLPVLAELHTLSWWMFPSPFMLNFGSSPKVIIVKEENYPTWHDIHNVFGLSSFPVKWKKCENYNF